MMKSRFRTFLVFSLAIGWPDLSCRNVLAAKGIPGIEFLGLGYDIVKGNPRGTSTSELDPGYRQRALDLKNNGATTLDGQYALPNQVESIAAASCKFDSESVELSDKESYTKELSKEATQDIGVSASGSYGPVKASGSIAYSKSEKFEEFKSTTVKTQTTVFEAKAVCTEFDLRLVPNVDPTFKPSFKQALDALPKEFDECNAANRNQFYKFIDTYGTHVVTEVVLGAKYILSTEMRASDVMELQKQSIDVASSLSIEIAASIKATKDPSPAKAASPGDGGYKVIIENFPGGNVTAPAPAPKPPSTPASAGGGGGFGGGSISFSYGQTSSSSTAEETTTQIAQKSTRVTEITIGGRPPKGQNWIEWAASVPERPMPIKVTLKGYFEYMSEDQGKVFMQAVLAKYGIVLDQNVEGLSDTIKATHFGVFTVNAVPISSYSNTATSHYRTLMSANFPAVAKKSSGAAPQKLLLVPDDSLTQREKGDDVSWKATTKCPAGKYLCGIRTIYDRCNGEGYFSVTDDLGITMIDVWCCTKEGDDAKNDFQEIYVDDRYDFCIDQRTPVKCPEKSWIVGFQGRSYSYRDGAKTDPEGLNGLRIFCSDDPTKALTVEAGGDYGTWDVPKMAPDGNLFNGVRVLSDVSTEISATRKTVPKELGIANIEFLYEPVSLSTSLTTSFYSYEAIWAGSKAVVSAYFATPIYGVLVPSPLDDDKFVALNKNAYLNSGVSTYFGLMSTTDPSIARFGLRIFESTTFSSRDMESFSFLSADNLEKNASITAGVIHPDGFALNKLFGFDEGFEVREASQGGRHIQILFSNTVGCTVDEIPTVAVFPIVFSEGGKLPNRASEISVFLRDEYWKGSALIPACSNGKGETAMIAGPALGGSTGYSILRISRKVNVKGLLHGYVPKEGVPMCPERSNTIPGMRYCMEMKNDRRFVRFFFDEPFEDVPSVIVTPIAPSGHDPATNPTAMALTMVMDITRSSTSVLCEFTGVGAIGFTVVITGPPRLASAVGRKKSCSAI